MTNFSNPADDTIQQILEKAHHIAVVGLSPKANRPSHEVAKHMQGYGYHIIPVRPATEEVLGEKCFPDLKAVDKPIDLVNVFLNPSRLAELVDSCIELKTPVIWLQEGVINEEAALKAQQAGIQVIMDRCIYKEHKRLLD